MAAVERRFVKKIPSSGVGPAFKLSLPHKFVNLHFGDLVGKTFELASSATTNKFWHASITPRRNRDRQEFCLRGWKLFAEAHAVQAGDQFAFELVRSNRLVISLLTRAKDSDNMQADAERFQGQEACSPCESPCGEPQDPFASAFPMEAPSLEDLGDALADGDDLASWLDGSSPKSGSVPLLKLESQGGLSQSQSLSSGSLCDKALAERPDSCYADDLQETGQYQALASSPTGQDMVVPELQNDASMLPLLKGILSDDEEDMCEAAMSGVSRSSTIMSGLDMAADPLMQLTSRASLGGSSHASGPNASGSEAEHRAQLAEVVRQVRPAMQARNQLHQHHSGMLGTKRPCASPWAEGWDDKQDCPLDGYNRAKRHADQRSLARRYSAPAVPSVIQDNKVDEEVQQLSGTIKNLQDNANRCQLQALKAQEQQARLRVFLAESRDCLQNTQQATFLLEKLAGVLVSGCQETAPQAVRHAMHSTQTEMVSSMDAIRSGIQGFLSIRA